MKLIIFGKQLTEADKKGLLTLLGYAKIQEQSVAFVDVQYEHIDVNKVNCAVCIGRSLKEVAKAFVDSGQFKPTDLIGKDVVDEVNKFFLYNIPLNVPEMFGADEDKMFTWNKLQQVAKYYLEWTAEATPSDNGTIEEMKDDLQEIYGTETPQVVNKTTSSPAPQGSVVSTTSSVSQAGNKVVIDVGALSDQLEAIMTEALDAPSVGKSLQLSEKIVLESPMGLVTIYPSNRIPEDDPGAKLSFKDALALVKMSMFFQATKITFELKSDA